MKERVILVDEQDQTVGEMEKLDAHRRGELHRAFSIFLFNDKQEFLLQKRALTKYHSAGLWTNSCCGHPRPGEQIADAASRRLTEELGIHVPLEWKFTFQYYAVLDNELIENEIDHVFIGRCNHLPDPNPDEASACRFLSFGDLEKEIEHNSKTFTVWFQKVYQRFK